MAQSPERALHQVSGGRAADDPLGLALPLSSAGSRVPVRMETLSGGMAKRCRANAARRTPDSSRLPRPALVGANSFRAQQGRAGHGMAGPGGV